MQGKLRGKTREKARQRKDGQNLFVNKQPSGKRIMLFDVILSSHSAPQRAIKTYISLHFVFQIENLSSFGVHCAAKSVLLPGGIWCIHCSEGNNNI